MTREPRALDSEEILAHYSEGRRKAVRAMAKSIGRGEVVLDAIALADDMLERAINAGAVMLTENHTRKMRELARELTT